MFSPAGRAEELLAYAARRVPWWREALRGAPRPVRWGARELPTTDRGLVSARFDDLVADRAVTRAQALAHYRSRPQDPMPGGIRVFLSAGARGEPVPLLYDEPAWRAYVRAIVRMLAAAGAPPDGTVALVGTDDPAHTLWRLQELAPPGRAVAVGLQDGVEQACARLEELQPDALYGIASAIALLAERAPRIAPRLVVTGTDALDPAGRAAIRRAFGADPLVSYGLTEAGLVAAQCRFGGALHVNEADVLLERADDRVCATNLGNRLQPMIRFALPERLRLDAGPCACGGAPLRLTLCGGRRTVVWRLPGLAGGTVALHPIVLRSALDPLALPRLPRAAWEGASLRVALPLRGADEAEGRLRRALERAGVDPRALAVVADSDALV